MVAATFDLNSVRENCILGGTSGAVNSPSGTSSYFISVSFWNRNNTAYCGLQLFYDLYAGNLYMRAIRNGGAIFDDWFKYQGTRVSA